MMVRMLPGCPLHYEKSRETWTDGNLERITFMFFSSAPLSTSKLKFTITGFTILKSFQKTDKQTHNVPISEFILDLLIDLTTFVESRQTTKIT